MARLLEKSYTWPQKDGEAFYPDYTDRQQKLYEQLKETRDILYFPAGDGNACYLVVKARPLTLQHIEIGDAWQVPYPQIRGLRFDDVKDRLKHSLKADAAAPVKRTRTLKRVEVDF